jgi:hypothetical protein
MRIALILVATLAAGTASATLNKTHPLVIQDEDTRIHCNDGFYWDPKLEMCIAPIR